MVMGLGKLDRPGLRILAHGHAEPVPDRGIRQGQLREEPPALPIRW